MRMRATTNERKEEKESRKEEEKDREEARGSEQAWKHKRKKKREKKGERARARKLTGLLTQSARTVQACGMEQKDSKSEHRHGRKPQKNTESTVGRSAGLLTGPENQVGSKACRRRARRWRGRRS